MNAFSLFLNKKVKIINFPSVIVSGEYCAGFGECSGGLRVFGSNLHPIHWVTKHQWWNRIQFAICTTLHDVCVTATFHADRRIRRLLRDSDNEQADRPRAGSTSPVDTAVYGQWSTFTQQRHQRRRQRCRRWWSCSTLHQVHLQLLHAWEQSTARGDVTVIVRKAEK